MSITLITDAGSEQSFPITENASEVGSIEWAILQHARACGLVLRTIDGEIEYDKRTREAARENARSEIRDGLIEYYKYDDNETLNDILEHLGLPRKENKWLVRVLCEGQMVLEVIVTADNESDAEDKVSSNFDVLTTEVEVEFDYSGEGEIDDSNTFEYEFGNVFDFLTFDYEVEEYEG